MPRPIASLPNPSAALATVVNGIMVMSREWYQKLAELVDRTPITGTVTFAAATTAAVTFETPELSTDYNISVDASENKTFWVTSKTTTGFTLNASASTSAAVGWTLVRR